MSALAELDRSNVVDIDLGSAEFKANAIATWPSGRGARRSMCSAAVPRRWWSAAMPTCTACSPTPKTSPRRCRAARLGAVQQDHGRAVRHPDGRRAACPRPPPLMPAFSSRRIEQLKESITTMVDGMLDEIEKNGPEFDAMQDLGAHLVVDALLTAMVAMDERRRRSSSRSTTSFPAPPTSSPASPGRRSSARRSIAPWKRSRSSSRSGAPARVRISSAISSMPATPATSSTNASCSIRFSASAAHRCRQRAAPPAARFICSTPTTISASS